MNTKEESKEMLDEKTKKEVGYLLDVIRDAEHTKEYYSGTDLSIWWIAKKNYEEAEERLSDATEQLFEIAKKHGISYNSLLSCAEEE